MDTHQKDAIKIFEKIRLLTKIRVAFVVIMLWTLASVLVFIINPAARKGPLGFGPPAAMMIYHAKDGGFSISYPQNWVVIETPQGSHGDKEIVAVIVVSGRYGADITIARKFFPAGDIDHVVDWGQSRAALHADYNPLSLEPLTDKQPGGFFQEYTWVSSSQYSITRRCQDVYIFAIGAGYDLSFCSKEEDWPSLENIFVQMRQSFSARGESR